MRKNPLLYCGIALLSLSWLFVGVRYDREFHEPHLLLKYRPALQWRFESPLGMSDATVTDLTPEKQIAEMAYREFHANSPIRHNPVARTIPYLLLLSTLICLTVGIGKSISNTLVNPDNHG